MSDKDIEPQQAFPYTGLGSDGMTLRDYFAAKAMAVLMTSAWSIPHAEVASKAYWFAEQMMKAREQANAPEIERINAHIKELEDAVKAEREACAKVCEEYANDSRTGATCAEAIRARGQA